MLTWSSLSGRGRDRVHARRMAECLVLGKRCSAAATWTIMKPLLRPPCFVRNAGRSEIAGFDQLFDALLGDARQLGDRDRKQVPSRSTRSGRGSCRPLRIFFSVGKTSGLSVTELISRSSTLAHEYQRVAGSAVHLRDAAQAVGVLHLAAGLVAAGDLALLAVVDEEVADPGRDQGLARVAGARRGSRARRPRPFRASPRSSSAPTASAHNRRDARPRAGSGPRSRS